MMYNWHNIWLDTFNRWIHSISCYRWIDSKSDRLKLILWGIHLYGLYSLTVSSFKLLNTAPQIVFFILLYRHWHVGLQFFIFKNFLLREVFIDVKMRQVSRWFSRENSRRYTDLLVSNSLILVNNFDIRYSLKNHGIIQQIEAWFAFIDHHPVESCPGCSLLPRFVDGNIRWRSFALKFIYLRLKFIYLCLKCYRRFQGRHLHRWCRYDRWIFPDDLFDRLFGILDNDRLLYLCVLLCVFIHVTFK